MGLLSAKSRRCVTNWQSIIVLGGQSTQLRLRFDFFPEVSITFQRSIARICSASFLSWRNAASSDI